MGDNYYFDKVSFKELVMPGNVSISDYYNGLPSISPAVVNGVYENITTTNGLATPTSVRINYGYNLSNFTPSNLTDWYQPYTASYSSSSVFPSGQIDGKNWKHFNAIIVGGGGGGGASGKSPSSTSSNGGGGGAGGAGGMFLFFQCVPIATYFENNYIEFLAGNAGNGGKNTGDDITAANAGGTSWIKNASGNYSLYANGGNAGEQGPDSNTGNDGNAGVSGNGGTGGRYLNPTDPNGTGGAGTPFNKGGPDAAGGNGGTINTFWQPVLPPTVYSGYGNGGNGGVPNFVPDGNPGNNGGDGYIEIYLFIQ